MKFLFFIILLFPFFLSTDIASERGQILLSIQSKKKSIYVNSIYEDSQLLSKLYDVPSSKILAYSCIESKFGKKSDIPTKLRLLEIASRLEKAENLDTRKERKVKALISRFKLFLMD